MSLKVISGGFQLGADERQLVNEQRAITQAINKNFIQVGAAWLKTSNKNPFNDDWYTHQHLDVNLQSWIDDEALRDRNVGFNLQAGWMDVDIDASDPEYNECILAAMDYLAIDSRFRFGRLSVGCASHVFLQLGEEESANYGELIRFEPAEFRISNRRYHVQLRSIPTNIDAKNLAVAAKQTVVPGSVYTHKNDAGRPDISVWWSRNEVAKNVSNIAETTPRRVNFNEVVRAIAFGTFLYLIKHEWVEGGRQMTATRISGWLARLVQDSAAINNSEVTSASVFCPVDCDATAEKLLEFICDFCGDEEKYMRVRTYREAVEKLRRNPDAKIPGWPAMIDMFNEERVNAMRTVFMPGADVSPLMKMAERYIYDESDNKYIDRERFFTGSNFAHEGYELMRREAGNFVAIGGKKRNAFQMFEASEMRRRVGKRDLYPDLEPAQIYRVTATGRVLSDEEPKNKSELTIFNTWRGWAVGMPSEINEELMDDLIKRLDRVLGYLTQDNPRQIDWIKKWLAWMFQNPGTKQQIAWVVVGEQGTGKSWVGEVLIPAMVGTALWGAASPKVVDGAFAVEPFINKMFVFVDEAKFSNDVAVDEIKKLIRSSNVPGAEKFESSRTYRIFARLMFASNRYDIGLGQANMIDRALFFTKTYDREFLEMSEMDFRRWAETLKPFFEEFTQLLEREDVKEHLMHYFMKYPTSKPEVESIEHSSSRDPIIVRNNMSWARRVAKRIVEEGRIFEDLDITYPFAKNDLAKKSAEVMLELGLKNVQADKVWNEFHSSGMVENVRVGNAIKFRFRWKYGSLVEKFSEAINVVLEPDFIILEDDYGLNDCDGTKRPPWKGNRQGVVKEAKNAY